MRGGLHLWCKGSASSGLGGGSASRGRGVCIQARTGKAGGTHPTGMLSCYFYAKKF